MKIQIISALFSLLFYSSITLSVDSESIIGIDNKLRNINVNNDKSKRSSSRVKIDYIQQAIVFKRIRNRSNNQIDNESAYEVDNECNYSSTGEGCAFSGLISMGTPSSYIEKYSMFAVIGAGIKLPEDQIESFNGIDD